MRKVWIKFQILTYKLKLLTYTSLYDEKIIKKGRYKHTHFSYWYHNPVILIKDTFGKT